MKPLHKLHRKRVHLHDTVYAIREWHFVKQWKWGKYERGTLKVRYYGCFIKFTYYTGVSYD